MKILCKGVLGSRLYGTHYEKGEHPFYPDYVSDYDYRGVFLPERKELLSLFPGSDEKRELCKDTGEDVVLYSLPKFLKLCKTNNPNILDFLFADNYDIITPEFKKILDVRQNFLSLQSFNSFRGFIKSQVKRLVNHKKWISDYESIFDFLDLLKSNLDKFNYAFIAKTFSKFLAEQLYPNANKEEPPFCSVDPQAFFGSFYFNLYKKPDIVNYIYWKDIKSGDSIKLPKIEELLNKFSLKKVSNTQYVVFSEGNGILNADFSLNCSSNLKISKSSNPIAFMSLDTSAYKADCTKNDGIWNWLCNRNDSRFKLEEQFGYDTKHAAHSVRLALNLKEILLENNYTPKLAGDKLSYVRSILQGKVSYDDLIAKVDSLEKEAEKLVKKSTLPESVSNEFVDNLYFDILGLSV